MSGDLPWIAMFVFVLGWFTYFETRAFRHPERNTTLSHFIWSVGQKWPLSIFLWGLLIGGLAVHFFWNWCPAAGSGVGLLSGG